MNGPTGPGRSWTAWGLVVGPVAFVSAWAIGGLRMPDYSPVHDAISELAAIGSPERALMTTGFVVYGVAVMVGATSTRSTVIARVWPALVVNGLATLAVAALPLDASAAGDRAHGVAAGVGYVSLALVPALAAAPLERSGHRRAALVSVAAGVGIGACLALTAVADAKGAFQRTGLGIGDAWLIAAGTFLLATRSRLSASEEVIAR